MKTKTGFIIVAFILLAVITFMSYLYITTNAIKNKAIINNPILKTVDTNKGTVEIEVKPGENENIIIQEAKKKLSEERKVKIIDNLENKTNTIEETPEEKQKSIEDMKNILLK